MRLAECEICYPDHPELLDQNEEWVKLVKRNQTEKIRLHDYSRFFAVPGLYEEVVYKELKCCSPITVCSLLKEQMTGKRDKKLRVLDFGAGNGMIGECLKKMEDCETMVGIDIIEEARAATFRDYPGVYDDYRVMDLSRITAVEEEWLKRWKFNVLITVAALGYGDIPTLAFLNAFNMVENDGWVAFNIKDRFILENDHSGFQKTIEYMTGGFMKLIASHRYCHRLSMSGEPLFYQAVIGRKIKDIDSPEQIIKNLQRISN
jgi:predicted TPR repeat methyltransferase